MKLGIALITYSRRERALSTLAALLQHTTHTASWCVADDGSRDGTADAIRHKHPSIPVLSGPNRGVAWNKNRALWHLRHCEVVLLIEDDASPTEDGWEQAWIEGTQLHGHLNFNGGWFQDGIVSGSGTVVDPYLSQGTSAQVVGYSREALEHVGYLDTRFRSYGMGHVEHSFRMIRAGYGGQVVSGGMGDFDGWQLGTESAFQVHRRQPPRVLFKLLTSPVHVTHEHSHRDPCPVREAANQVRFAELVLGQVYRPPWSCDSEMATFRAEMAGTREVVAPLRLIA